MSLALARRIESINAAALIEHCAVGQRLFPEAGCATLAVGGGVAAFLGANSPINYAVGMGLEGVVATEDVAKVVDFFRERKTKPRIHICPYTDGSLIAALREHGFQLHEFVNVLTRSLNEAELQRQPAPAIAVRLARADEAELWARTVYEGFVPHNPYDETHRRLGLMFFHGSTMRSYFAEIDGQIAAAGGMFVAGDYVALMATSTLSAFRNRGIHTALIHARLRDAVTFGCTWAGLFASPGSISEHNAEKLGFRVSYTKAGMTAG